MKKLQKGFTLIELMVVIVIIGILTAIAIPNFVGAQDRAKIASVKSNMHVFRTVLETYAVDYAGLYPVDVATLRNVAESSPQGAYWKELANPFTQVSGEAEAYATLSSPADITGQQAEILPGVVGYLRNADADPLADPDPAGNNQANPYALYGGSKYPGQAILEKGEPFILSNR